MKLVAPNGKRITHSVDTITVLHRISHVWDASQGKDGFAYDVDQLEDFSDTIEPVRDDDGQEVFLDEDGEDWPRNQLKLIP